MESKYKATRKFSSKLADGDTLQRLIATTDTMLNTLITMSSALLAVIVIFENFVKSPLARIIIVLIFFMGLVISFLGVLPFNIRYDIEEEEELKQQQINTFLRKRRHLWWSAGVLATGFLLIVMDLIIDVINNYSH